VVAVVTEGLSTADGQYLGVRLVDTVTGRVLLQRNLRGASGPVHGVLVDHSLVLHYWSQTASRHEVFVADLYDRREDPGVLSLLFGKEVTSTDLPLALVQQFVLPAGPVVAMGVTSTLKVMYEITFFTSPPGRYPPFGYLLPGE
jgi:hypothetical protein